MHTEAAAIPTHRSSLLAQEAGMAGLRGGSVGAELDLGGRFQY